jgi:DprA/Smf-like nucleotide binding protein involved in DNA uptake
MGKRNAKETVHIDEINLRSELSTTTVAAAVLNLELHSVVNGLPGKCIEYPDNPHIHQKSKKYAIHVDACKIYAWNE